MGAHDDEAPITVAPFTSRISPVVVRAAEQTTTNPVSLSQATTVKVSAAVRGAHMRCSSTSCLFRAKYTQYVTLGPEYTQTTEGAEASATSCTTRQKNVTPSQ